MSARGEVASPNPHSSSTMFTDSTVARNAEMAKPPFELNPEQMEALRQLQAERQQIRSHGRLMNPEDLAANRMGQVTDEQRRALISQASGFGIIGVVLWLVLLGAIVAASGRFLADNPVIGLVVLFATLFLMLWVVGRIASIP